MLSGLENKQEDHVGVLHTRDGPNLARGEGERKCAFLVEGVGSHARVEEGLQGLRKLWGSGGISPMRVGCVCMKVEEEKCSELSMKA